MGDVLVLGSGFAGLWAALGAARRADELGADVSVTVVSATPYHDIRVRNYEPDLTNCRIPLAEVLDPAGIGHVTAEVTAVDPANRTVLTAAGPRTYDRLIVALGSSVAVPDLPGLREHGFDVDTYDGAMRLQQHLAGLTAQSTVVVVGAGLTGIEAACELAGRHRVVLVDRNPRVGSDMGDAARPVIEKALRDNGVESRCGVGVTAVEPNAVTLTTGEVLAASTVVWCAGMRANPLTASLGVPLDALGRVAVDDHLEVIGLPGVFAAGDVAAARMDDEHLSVMSCQHGRPMGRYAGYNAVSELLSAPLLTLRIPWYVTVLDLGAAGAVYTEGWDRTVVATGAEAKATKNVINRERIYPPRTGRREDLLAAAAPDLQARPTPKG
jgi:NADH:ubiquinone reductase (H+-translocating)